MMSASAIGAPAGFLARITSLEREVSFLKQKVEDDALWKHILQQFVLDNFAFDIQGVLLNRNQPSSRQRRSIPSATSTSNQRNSYLPGPAIKRKAATSSKYKRSVKVERAETMKTRLRGGVSYQQEEDEESDDISPGCFMDDDNDQEHCFGGVMEDGLEVNVNPKDLIITPDICAEVTEEVEDPAVVAARNLKRQQQDKDYNDEEQIHDDDGGESSADESSSSSSEDGGLARRPHRKMEWTLIGTYPNVETMKQQFNLREWGLSTKQKTDKGVKVYYYCKECRKHGPGKLLVKYKDENSEVELSKNHLEHDHSTKKRLTEEMKVEIFNLYKAGMNDSSKILGALKISKPHMRQPSVKQVCHILKPHRRLERKIKLKEKKKLAKEKEKQKNDPMDPTHSSEKRKRVKKAGPSGGALLLPFSSSAGPSSTLTLQQQQNLSQFMSQQELGGGREFQRPNIVGFQAQQLQQFYQQPQQPSFDNLNANITQHYQN